MPKRSLMLAGGGLKIAFQAGVLQVWLDRNFSPITAVNVNWSQLPRLVHARSLFKLDAFRRKIFPAWGLDWSGFAPVGARRRSTSIISQNTIFIRSPRRK